MLGKIKNLFRKKRLKSIAKNSIREPKSIEEIISNLNLYLKESKIDYKFFTSKVTAPLTDLDILNQIGLNCVVNYDKEKIEIRVLDLLQYIISNLTGKEIMLYVNHKGYVTEITFDEREEEEVSLTD